MTFAVGSLVKARGREWVVQPESESDLLILRPLGGTDHEVTGIYLPLESVESASFSLPDPTAPGDYRSCGLLRDAVRLGFRASTGPFRSFARLAVEPRPYQLVPLLMALRLNPVRLLIADDVGIGKTVEACLIARELLDRGEINSIGVLCPPHLAEQWQNELRDKFNIEAQLVLPGTARRLERHCGANQSLFDVFPHVIVSLDYIKSDRRRDEFLRTCPDLVIVDEAHSCVFAGERRGSRHQRNQLVKGISRLQRHLLLVTATPHSGKEDAFRRLLSFLNPEFARLPDDLSGKIHEHSRRHLAQYFVQRRRADIRDFLEETVFPSRLEAEDHYNLSPAYKKLFQRVLAYTRESVQSETKNKRESRVRWWSALALLRSLASSPAAAAATLRSRATTSAAENEADIEAMGRQSILDLEEEAENERPDITPGSDVSEFSPDQRKERQRLLEMAREAEKLFGKADTKVTGIIEIIKKLLAERFHPIIFCRFIPTAEYVAETLREKIKDVEVSAVTGKLPPQEREHRVNELGNNEHRVLVCTDCLSEGINLQDHFDAVIHYDLSWNPTRHEQREGRVDRFGQPRAEVRVLTYYGIDNQIDGLVLDVLIKKHKTIRSSLGISVPVPVDTGQIVEAIFEGLLLRKQDQEGHQTPWLPGLEPPQKEALYKAWEDVSEREKTSRTMFAQRTIKTDEVARELAEVRQAIGASVQIKEFVEAALSANQTIIQQKDGATYFDLSETPRSLRDMLPCEQTFTARYALPLSDGQLYLNRTHPLVENLAAHVMDTALDSFASAIAKRCGVIRSKSVSTRTTVLLLRFRYHIITIRGAKRSPLLAEECKVMAFSGAPDRAHWLPDNEAEKLLGFLPDENISPDVATHQLRRIIDKVDVLSPYLAEVSRLRGQELLAAHTRIREAAKVKGVSHKVEPKLPVDILGLYVYLPAQT